KLAGGETIFTRELGAASSASPASTTNARAGYSTAERRNFSGRWAANRAKSDDRPVVATGFWLVAIVFPIEDAGIEPGFGISRACERSAGAGLKRGGRPALTS